MLVSATPTTSKLQPHEIFYYGYQVEGRGLTEAGDLRRNFQDRLALYDGLLSGVLKPYVGGRAIDIGCGYGNFIYYLEQRGLHAEGVDLDPSQVALAQSIGLKAIVGEAKEYLSTNGPYTIVSAFDIIEHLSKDAAVDLLQAAFRNLEPGGAMIIQCPCADGFTGNHDLWNDFTHRWGASSNMLRQLLLATGFGQVRSIDLTLPPYPVSIKARLKNIFRKAARKMLRPLFSLVGITTPTIWSNSQIVIGYKPT